MVTFPNAKINIGLDILARRPDGYHDIASCFYPIPWTDILEVIPAEHMQFELSGLAIPGNSEDNLCQKAYHLLRTHFEIPAVRIHLHKLLPTGAGLGGGSADGAYTLRLLNDIFELSLSQTELESYAAQLGSDCPFFIKNQPVYAQGRGYDFSEIKLDLSGMYIFIVKPPIHVSTQEAYAGIVPDTPGQSVKSILENDPIASWKDSLKNDFEASIFKKYPAIAAIKDKLYEQGAVYASMSGSGAALYGLFDTPIDSITDAFPENYTCWQGML